LTGRIAPETPERVGKQGEIHLKARLLVRCEGVMRNFFSKIIAKLFYRIYKKINDLISIYYIPTNTIIQKGKR